MAKRPSQRFKLNHVRIAFPSLKTPQAPEGSTKVTYNFTVLMEERGEAHKIVHEALKKMKADPEVLKYAKVKNGDQLEISITPGNDKTDENGKVFDGFENTVTFTPKANPDYPPILLDEHKSQVQREDADDKFYAGCYVNAVISAFPYNTAGRKGITFGIDAVQFAANGERLAGGGIDVDKWFDDEPESEMAATKDEEW